MLAKVAPLVVLLCKLHPPFKSWRKGPKQGKEPAGGPDMTKEVPGAIDRKRQRRPLKLAMRKRRRKNAKEDTAFRASGQSSPQWNKHTWK